jgi:GNAT superfamily N-acetyltransferase
VLRDGRADADVEFNGDDEPGTFHLAAVDGDGAPLGVATFFLNRTALRTSAVQPYQLRGMAVHPAHQGQGIGRLIIESAIDRLRRHGVDVLWANARDEALGFYRSVGMEVVGAGFKTETGRPHHAVVLDL